MDINKIAKSIDPKILRKKLNDIDPLEILGNLGLSLQDAQTVMTGDMTPISKKRLDILDFNLIINKYNNFVNLNLIHYFFKKAKLKEAFTEDEINAYKEAWKNWFDFVFLLGERSIFQLSEELQDKSLIIKIDEDYYQMASFQNINQINYLGENVKF